MGEKATTKKFRACESSSKLDEQDKVFNGVPLHLVILVDVSTKISKNVDSKKTKTFEKVSLYDKDTYVHAHIVKPIDFVDNDYDTTPTENIVDYVETTTNPYVEPHVEQSGEPFVEPPTETTTKLTIDILGFDTYLNDVLNKGDDYTKELRNKDP